MAIFAALSSKCTPFTITLPLAMTPMDTALVGLFLVTPVPPVPPPQAAMRAANDSDAISCTVLRSVFMIAVPLAFATPSLNPFGEFRSVRSSDDRREPGERRVDLDQLVCRFVGTHRAHPGIAIGPGGRGAL